MRFCDKDGDSFDFHVGKRPVNYNFGFGMR